MTQGVAFLALRTFINGIVYLLNFTLKKGFGTGAKPCSIMANVFDLGFFFPFKNETLEFLTGKHSIWQSQRASPKAAKRGPWFQSRVPPLRSLPLLTGMSKPSAKKVRSTALPHKGQF